MTPAARVQAAIELLDEIIAAARDAGPAADTVIRRGFKQRRYAGSGDRRAIRELVYRTIRRFGERPSSGRAAMLGLAAEDAEITELFDGSPHGPAPIAAGETATAGDRIPAWIGPHLDPLAGPPDGLLGRAPLDLRINRLKATREQVLELLPEAAATPYSPLGLRLPEGFAIERHELWQSGMVEVQDEGSQLVALACRAQPGSLAIDLCAGAGGKTLALAAEMADSGRLLASDVSKARLSKLPPRLQRAGVTNVETRLLDAGREGEALSAFRQQADLVLVDAPCSGSGTWRRNPETRWRLSPDRLSQLVRTQAWLLDMAAALARPGGQLVYAVCSVVADEGRLQAEAFGRRHPSLVQVNPSIGAGTAAGGGRLLVPSRDGTDGFFIACWRVPC